MVVREYEVRDKNGDSVMRFDAEQLIYDESDEFLMAVLNNKVHLEYTLKEGDVVIDINDDEVPFADMRTYDDWRENH